MSKFEDRFAEFLKEKGISLYQVALSIGEDPSKVDKIIFLKRPATFEKRLEILQKLADSPLLNIDVVVMAAWLAIDYLPKDVILKAANEVLEEKRA